MIAGTNYYLTQTKVPRLRTTLWCRNSSSNSSSCSSCVNHIVSLVSATKTTIITGSGRNRGSQRVGIGSCKVRQFSYLSQPQHPQQQKYLPYILPPSYHHQCIQRRCMARNRSKRRSSLIFLEDHALSPRRYPPTTTNTTTTSTNDNPSSIIYDPNIRHHRQHQSKIRLPLREQEMMETEQLFQEINAIVPEMTSSLFHHHHLHYCIKQHLWYRATPILNEEDDEEEDINNNNKDDYDNDPQQRLEKQKESSSLRLLPKYYKIDIGLTVRSLESIGDVLLLTLFNNSQKENGPRLPDLNSRRDHLDPYKKKMKTSLPFEEGELLFAIVWEGVEEDKNDHEFYLVTGRNIWRSPIKGIATLNMEYIHRNWTTDPPTIDTVLLSIVCTREDYYSKISEMYDGPLIVPDVENSTSGPNRQKKRIDKFRTMEMDNDALEQHCHPWVSPDDYHSYVEANPP